MKDTDLVAFLQWATPRLQLRWPGFRKVRRQVGHRIERRRAELGLADVTAYRRWLDEHEEEWAVLDDLCRVTISRFGRDHGVWAALAADVLPRLAYEATDAGRRSVRAWSAGCGAGEEPYTLAIAWAIEVAPRWPELALEVIATDVDEHQLGRASRARYPSAAMRELPEAWRRAAFIRVDDEQLLRDEFRRVVRFTHRDVRGEPPEGTFDLVLCRNLAFTYFAEDVQRAVAATSRAALRPGGVLVVGMHEQLPEEVPGFMPVARCLYLATSD